MCFICSEGGTVCVLLMRYSMTNVWMDEIVCYVDEAWLTHVWMRLCVTVCVCRDRDSGIPGGTLRAPRVVVSVSCW